MAAAPITRELLGNTFTFTTDCFSITSSGGNVHRRHSPLELRDHFDAGEDRPAHWYEAQLRHYQLPPSKVKEHLQAEAARGRPPRRPGRARRVCKAREGHA